MSLKYRDSSGNETSVAGLNGTSGELVPSASLMKSGTLTIPATTAGGNGQMSVTFDTAMPDTDYVLNFESVGNAWYNLTLQAQKTVNGFTVVYQNVDTTASSGAASINWQAFKLMTDEQTALDEASIAQNTANIADIQTVIPSDASSSNQLITQTAFNSASNQNWKLISNAGGATAYTGFRMGGNEGSIDGTLALMEHSGLIIINFNNISVANVIGSIYGNPAIGIDSTNKILYIRTSAYRAYKVLWNNGILVQVSRSTTAPDGITFTNVVGDKLISQSNLTSSVTSGSTAPITSGGVYSAIATAIYSFMISSTTFESGVSASDIYGRRTGNVMQLNFNTLSITTAKNAHNLLCTLPSTCPAVSGTAFFTATDVNTGNNYMLYVANSREIHARTTIPANTDLVATGIYCIA